MRVVYAAASPRARVVVALLLRSLRFRQFLLRRRLPRGRVGVRPHNLLQLERGGTRRHVELVDVGLVPPRLKQPARHAQRASARNARVGNIHPSLFGVTYGIFWPELKNSIFWLYCLRLGPY